MDRRTFLKTATAASVLFGLTDFEELYAKGQSDPHVGKIWKGWKKGHFQIHFIYTGVCESAFYIFPDGTTMLLDCGDHNAKGRGAEAVPILPNSERHSGEWIARYIERVNPSGRNVDYIVLSHYHNDHCGGTSFYASKQMRDGKEYFIDGFTQVAETIRFRKGIDRAWPTFDDPLPMPDDYDGGAVGHVRRFYEYEIKHHGLEMERFRLGATDQIVPLRGGCRDFIVRNIAANGRICTEDGTVTDLYAERIKKKGLKSVRENGMSLGMVFSYGPFRLYTAGDFSDSWEEDDGSIFRIEDAIADVCGRANVAKINHHGHHSMTRKLVGALRSQVYIGCIWDQAHTTSDTAEVISDRTIYPEKRYICPGILPVERRAKDEGKEWMADVPTASYEGSHIIIDVEPGGRKYSVNYIGAADETMTVKSVMNFKTSS